MQMQDLCVIFCLQVQLETMFPDWQTIEQQWEVIKFAMDLSPDGKYKFVHLICDRLATFLGSQEEPNYWNIGNKLRFLETLPKQRGIEPHLSDWIYLCPETGEFKFHDGSFQQSRFYMHMHITEEKHREAAVILFQDASSDQSMSVEPSGASYSLVGLGVGCEVDCLPVGLDLLQEVTRHQTVHTMRVLLNNADGLYTAVSLRVEAKRSELTFINRRVQCVKRHYHDKRVIEYIVTASQLVNLCSIPKDDPAVPHTLLIMSGSENLAEIKCSSHPEEVLRSFIRSSHHCEELEKLEKLYLSGTRIERSLKLLFGGEDNPGFPSLQELYLVDTELDAADLEALGEAVKQNKLPQLQKINLEHNTLTGSLKHLFGGEDHPGFPSLQELDLDHTNLDAADLESLREAVKQNKLPQIQKINLGWNTLTGSLKHLFGEEDHPRLPSLQELNLADTELDAADLKTLCEAVKQNKLPQLQKLHLGRNTLTSSLKHLFGGEDHPGFPSLQELDLDHTNLDAADLEALREAVKQKKLPRLQKVQGVRGMHL